MSYRHSRSDTVQSIRLRNFKRRSGLQSCTPRKNDDDAAARRQEPFSSTAHSNNSRKSQTSNNLAKNHIVSEDYHQASSKLLSLEKKGEAAPTRKAAVRASTQLWKTAPHAAAEKREEGKVGRPVEQEPHQRRRPGPVPLPRGRRRGLRHRHRRLPRHRRRHRRNPRGRRSRRKGR